MALGCFSVSLSVKDITKSIEFYTGLGFEMFHDHSEHGYCILKDGTSVIGLYQGMFEGNILTFNPGWDQDAQPVDGFEDVRSIQARLQASGVDIGTSTDPEGEGIGHIILTDPDGNVIMFDQHVPKPA